MTGWQDYVIVDDGARALQAMPPGVAPERPSASSGSPA